MKLTISIKQAKLLLNVLYDSKQDWVEYKSKDSIDKLMQIEDLETKIYKSMPLRSLCAFVKRKK